MQTSCTQKGFYNLSSPTVSIKKQGAFALTLLPFPTVKFTCLKQALQVGLFKRTKAGKCIKAQVQSTVQE